MNQRTHFSRRTLFKGAGVLAASAALGACGTDAPAAGPEGTRKLPIPPLLEPVLEGDTRVFTLEAKPGTSRILPDLDTPTWGYNGSILGPTLRAAEGQKVRVDVINSLPELTTVHWHGMHLPAQMDGGPHQPIAPGATWAPEYPIAQQAATLWYHPHPHGITGIQTYRGLAGLFILDDANSQGSGLPHEYGVDDIPLILQDKRFNADGTLNETDREDVGLLGDTSIVNGISNPHFTATTRRVRFRVLDGATMRLFNLRFSDGRPFHLVASDGGLLDTPQEVDHVYLSPGERVEIVADFEPGETVVLRAVAFPDNLELNTDNAPDFGLADEFDLLTIAGPTGGAASGALPTGLNATLRSLPDTSGAREREFDMEWFQINGKLMDMRRIDEIVDNDDWEVWTVANKDNWIHNFHVHDAQFRVLSLERTKTTPLTGGWKDTILLAPGAVATVALRFTDYTSNRWPYMYHCHLMYHEDQGMMGQFLVVEPGQRPDPAIGRGLPSMSHEQGEQMPSMPPSTTHGH